jgi:hypothetical protein
VVGNGTLTRARKTLPSVVCCIRMIRSLRDRRAPTGPDLPSEAMPLAIRAVAAATGGSSAPYGRHSRGEHPAAGNPHTPVRNRVVDDPLASRPAVTSHSPGTCLKTNVASVPAEWGVCRVDSVRFSCVTTGPRSPGAGRERLSWTHPERAPVQGAPSPAHGERGTNHGQKRELAGASTDGRPCRSRSPKGEGPVSVA